MNSSPIHRSGDPLHSPLFEEVCSSSPKIPVAARGLGLLGSWMTDLEPSHCPCGFDCPAATEPERCVVCDVPLCLSCCLQEPALCIMCKEQQRNAASTFERERIQNLCSECRTAVGSTPTCCKIVDRLCRGCLAAHKCPAKLRYRSVY
jgi:hypothetical protein